MGKFAHGSTVFIVLLVWALPLCGCRDSRRETEHQRETEHRREPGRTVAMLVALDGKADDWAGVEPVLPEAELAGRGEHGRVDLKQLYFQTDARYLYVFARCTPSVQEQFEKDPVSGLLWDLYLDVDNRRDTGSEDLNLSRSFEAAGFDRRIRIGTGFRHDLRTDRVNPTTNIGVHAGTDFSGELWKSCIFGGDAVIAHGPDGVEAAIPLEVLDLRPGTTVRVLLRDMAYFAFSADAYREFTFAVPGQDHE